MEERDSGNQWNRPSVSDWASDLGGRGHSGSVGRLVTKQDIVAVTAEYRTKAKVLVSVDPVRSHGFRAPEALPGSTAL